VSRHGGDVHGWALTTGIRRENIIDFSASINPLGTPREVLRTIRARLHDVEHYPDPDSTELRTRLSAAFDLDPSVILCGNGCTELNYLLPRALPLRKVLIVRPTFNEYERACATASPGCAVASYPLRARNDFELDPVAVLHEAASVGADAVFLCNPNNPTGRVVERDIMEEAATLAADRKIYLVIDESFIEFTTAASAVGLTRGNPYLIVLRSMTKFYALPGLRLGWGVFPARVARALNAIREPWSVNTLAQAAGVAALSLTAHRNEPTCSFREKSSASKEDSRRSASTTPPPGRTTTAAVPPLPSNPEGLAGPEHPRARLLELQGLDKNYIRVAVRKKRDNDILLQRMASLLTNP
jgi:threonine-phosphate decarboxylase